MERQQKLLIGVGAVAVIGGLLFFVLRKPPEDQMRVPDGVVYYEGPMKAKGSNAWGTADGQSYTQDESKKLAGQ